MNLAVYVQFRPQYPCFLGRVCTEFAPQLMPFELNLQIPRVQKAESFPVDAPGIRDGFGIEDLDVDITHRIKRQVA